MDWHERKRARTRAALQQHALRLFAERGFDATTVEQIAAAAGVSHMTFFRHFPTKEDVVVADEYDPRIETLIRAQPTNVPAMTRVRAAMRIGLAEVYAADRTQLLERVRLIAKTPALRARLWDNQAATELLLARGLDGDEPPLATRAVAAGCLAAITTAILAWAERDGVEHLPELVDQALAALQDAACDAREAPA
ncbi:MAG TPA: TetR family transcriptional regulator [Jiangellales bacterium]|nr:TetR family transcriptional regulator [Jiangellales bacterium]